MLINIKHLDKQKVFAVLYHESTDLQSFQWESAKRKFDEHKSTIEGSPHYFDYCGYGHPMKIDLTPNIIDSTRYDEFYGEGKAEELITELKRQKIADIIKNSSPWGYQHMERTIPIRPGVADDVLMQEVVALNEMLRELRVDVQNYDRIVAAKQQALNEAAQAPSPSTNARFF